METAADMLVKAIEALPDQKPSWRGNAAKAARSRDEKPSRRDELPGGV